MDHFGEDTLAEIPPSVLADERRQDRPAESPDIDVPFTPAAQRVLDRSAELADLVGGQTVVTEHLLLAIASTPECAAAKLIAEQGSSSESVMSALQSVLGGENTPVAEEQNPRLERVIIRAKREAFRHSHAEVSTLHLLMALIRERAGAGVQRLTSASRLSAADRD